MKMNAPTALVITAIAIGIIAATFVAEYQKRYQPVSIIDRETRSVVERPPLVYIEAENLWFPAGSILTSKENGELILATPDTPQDLIVGIVTKSGLITNNYQRTFYNEPQSKTATGL